MIHKSIKINLIHKSINSNAFVKQVEPKIGLTVQLHTQAKGKIFGKEEELFYRATDYIGS